MEDRELRIGNLIYFAGDISICNLSLINCSALCKPIRLTEEWLLKFGFKKHSDTLWGHWTKDAGIFQISTRLPEGCFGLWVSGTLGSFEYVHQLQNLYFAITGQELTIKQS